MNYKQIRTLPNNTCSYCEKPEPIARSFPSESCRRMCQSCLDRVEMWPTNRLLEIRTDLLPGNAPLARYKRTVFSLAVAFLRGNPIPLLSTEDMASVRNTPIDCYNRFRSLSRCRSSEWMPVKVSPKVVLRYGAMPEVDCTYYDGVHRTCFACARGEQVPVWLPEPSYKTCRERQYQTLVLPDAILLGERDCDRWPLLPEAELDGRRILDIGCNSAMDGIMNCVLSKDASYVGYDNDQHAVEDGREVADRWELTDRFNIYHTPVERVTTFHQADVLWFFSVSKVIPFSDFHRAVNQSGAETVLLETHNQHDDPSSQTILASSEFRWAEIGRVTHTRGGAKIRGLWIGRKK